MYSVLQSRVLFIGRRMNSLLTNARSSVNPSPSHASSLSYGTACCLLVVRELLPRAVVVDEIERGLGVEGLEAISCEIDNGADAVYCATAAEPVCSRKHC